MALGVLAGMATLTAALVLAGGGARLVLDRRRLASWESAWQAVGPRWTRLP